MLVEVVNVFRKEDLTNAKRECYNQTSLVNLIILQLCDEEYKCRCLSSCSLLLSIV